MKGSAMAVVKIITDVFGTDNFADYEQRVYDSYQKRAEDEIITALDTVLSSMLFLQGLKALCGKCALRFHGYRSICIRLKSGHEYSVRSPVFLKAIPKKKEVGFRNDKKVGCVIQALNISALSRG